MKKWLVIVPVLLAPTLRAGEAALYYMNNAALEWEGTGARQTPSGWELKAKPQGNAIGLRWRQSVAEDLDVQVFCLANKPYYFFENGNTSSNPSLQQRGQTRIALQEVSADLRRPLEDSSAVGVLAGIQGVREVFKRKDISFWNVPDPSTVREALSAMGGYVGVYSLRLPSGSRGLFWDADVSIGHYFWARNTCKTEGGSVRGEGYFYMARLEAGWRFGPMRFGAGWIRQSLTINVPGAGKSLPGGAAASLPDNKTDFSSPFVSVTYAY
jgi:hypothetical protein